MFLKWAREITHIKYWFLHSLWVLNNSFCAMYPLCMVYVRKGTHCDLGFILDTANKCGRYEDACGDNREIVSHNALLPVWPQGSPQNHL